MSFLFRCVSCKQIYSPDKIRYRCDCGEVLDIEYSHIPKRAPAAWKLLFDSRLGSKTTRDRSGVWRFRELLPDISSEYIVSRPEGITNLYPGHSSICEYTGSTRIFLKHEGENPTGSFKDRGMTVGISTARFYKATSVACASTGNTSSSLASYAALAGIPCFVYLPAGKISPAKLAQTVAYGASVVPVDGDFDTAMRQVEQSAKERGMYLLNSVNPFRIEGQKTIAFDLLQQLDWQLPDWIVLPGGNLGNTAAIGKALHELRERGIIKKIPRLAVIQATCANPFYRSFRDNFQKSYTVSAETVATAIRIGNPVSFLRAKRAIIETDGIVEEVTDTQILDAKKTVDRAGIGCEPASATTIAGVRKLTSRGIIRAKDTVVCILTGHILKDSGYTNA